MTNKNNTVAKVFSLIITLLTVLTAISFTALSASDSNVIALKYDDYYNDYKSISILDCGEPESFKVGFGVPEGTKDDAVVAVDDGVLHAVGIGTARVELDGKVYTVKVEPAPISMFLLIGQSNMYGTDGNSTQSVANENGQVYSTYCHPSGLTTANAGKYVPSALTGEYSYINREGTKEKLEKSPVNRLTEEGDGKFGLDSAFAYEYNKITGDKVWTVNVAKGQTAIKSWQKGASQYENAVAVFKQAQKLMREEILAGHYVLMDYGYLWCHGCTDRLNSASDYLEGFLAMHENIRKDLSFDIDGDGKKEVLEFCNIIMPRKGSDDYIGYRNGIDADETDESFCCSFLDLEMSGPRVAQYWLVNNPDYPEINLVCNIGDKWVTMPDGTDGVSEYFNKHYKNGRVDYPVQEPQPEEWYTPTTPFEVHDNMHYNQIGYNEVGFETARNTAILRSRMKKPSGIRTEVTFYDWTGYREISSIESSNWADSRTVVVPVVYPVYESKSVTYKLSDNLNWELYDLTADYKSKGGTVESVGAYKNKKVSVTGSAAIKEGEAAYYFESDGDTLATKADSNYQNNTLKILKGTVTNNKHKGVIYQLDKNINLKKGNSWIVEWTGKSISESNSQMSIMLFGEYISTSNISSTDTNYFLYRYTREKNALLTVGLSKKESGGYVDSTASSKINPNEYHTYTLWNEPSADGNRVYFAVDGVWVGELTTASGRDFSFRFIGGKGKEINDYVFDNIKVVENLNCGKYGHSIISKTVKATCTAKGKLTAECIGCSYKTSTSTEALGHDFSGEYISDENATYLKDGTKSKICSRCGLRETVADKNSKLILSRPTKINAVGEANTVNLSWEPCKGAWGYRIYVRINGRWKAVKTVRTTIHVVTGLESGKEYTFAIRAYTYEGKDCVWSPTYTKVDVSTKPETPKIRVASTAKGRATVAWNDVNGETGYQVWYSTEKNGKYIKASNYSADTVKIYKTGLNSQATYYFKVRAYKRTDTGYAYSDFSNVRSVTLK